MAVKKTSKDLLNQVVILGSSLVYLGKGVADDVISELEKNKMLKTDEGKDLADKIRTEITNKGEQVKHSVLLQLGKVVNELNKAAKEAAKTKKTKKASRP